MKFFKTYTALFFAMVLALTFAFPVSASGTIDKDGYALVEVFLYSL